MNHSCLIKHLKFWALKVPCGDPTTVKVKEGEKVNLKQAVIENISDCNDEIVALLIHQRKLDDRVIGALLLDIPQQRSPVRQTSGFTSEGWEPIEEDEDNDKEDSNEEDILITYGWLCGGIIEVLMLDPCQAQNMHHMAQMSTLEG